MSPALTIVPPAEEAPAARAQRLQAEMKSASEDAYAGLIGSIEDVLARAREVQTLDAIPYGVRDEARRMVPDLEAHVLHMTSIKGRV